MNMNEETEQAIARAEKAEAALKSIRSIALSGHRDLIESTVDFSVIAHIVRETLNGEHTRPLSLSNPLDDIGDGIALHEAEQQITEREQ